MGCKSIVIDGTEFVPKGKAVTGSRRLVVLDRGWIFVGNLEVEGDSRTMVLRRAKNVRKWESGGFGGLTLDPKKSGAMLDDCADVVFKAGSEIFMVPVPEDWGE